MLNSLVSPADRADTAATRTVPRHVAVVMDGNGRWARQRYMPRFFGHKAGVAPLAIGAHFVLQALDLGFAGEGVFATRCLNFYRKLQWFFDSAALPP